MTYWSFVQILLFVTLTISTLILWIRLRRPPQEDPRLSRGLQMLQSKIAILEDLSDKTEDQVHQLTQLLELKCKQIEKLISDSENQILHIQQSMSKSMEVAKIFQDRIPHEEIIDRQNTLKYIKAARLANQGIDLDTIASQVDLTRGELEFVSKVNQQQLMFCEDSLPEWAKDTTQIASTNASPIKNAVIAAYPEEKNETELHSLKKIGEEIRKVTTTTQTSNLTTTSDNKELISPTANTAKNSREKNQKVTPVEFRRIEVNKNLG